MDPIEESLINLQSKKIEANIYKDNMEDNIQLLDIGYMIAMTGSDEVNRFAIKEYKNIQMAGYIPDNNARAYALGFNFPVEFRAAPTLTISNTGSSSGQMIQDGETGGKITTLVSTGMTSYNAEINVNLHEQSLSHKVI